MNNKVVERNARLRRRWWRRRPRRQGPSTKCRTEWKPSKVEHYLEALCRAAAFHPIFCVRLRIVRPRPEKALNVAGTELRCPFWRRRKENQDFMFGRPKADPKPTSCRTTLANAPQRWVQRLGLDTCLLFWDHYGLDVCVLLTLLWDPGTVKPTTSHLL